MSAGNRIAIIAVGLVAAILAFVALRPADDDTAPSDTVPTTTVAQTSTALTHVATATATATTVTREVESETIRVQGGQPVGGVEDISADKGERVRITVTADTADEVHLHGYDIEREVGPGKPAVFAFTANLEGVFEMELHSSETPIASLSVEPD
ncbi:MAG: hypothetical protein JHC95_03750 [Solirubrobacteraceae bacterium]|nr:hypothetical protein [Solirubrobacteraceae bacterium]